MFIADGVELIGYTSWDPIDLISASTAEMKKRYGYIYVDRDNDGMAHVSESKRRASAGISRSSQRTGRVSDNFMKKHTRQLTITDSRRTIKEKDEPPTVRKAGSVCLTKC